MTGNVCSEKSSYNIQLQLAIISQPTDLQSSKIQKIYSYLFSFMIPYFFVGDKRQERRAGEIKNDELTQVDKYCSV